MTDYLTDAEVEELERLEKLATPGPWRGTKPRLKGNVTFLVAARNALPKLLQERKALREELMQARNGFLAHLSLEDRLGYVERIDRALGRAKEPTP